jgi:periplasmic protein CpxP/Spy
MIKKSIILGMVLAVPLTLSAFPGDRTNCEGSHANRIEYITKRLDLTAGQKSKVEALFKEQDEKLKIIHEETRTRLQEMLSKEKMTKMDELKK